MTTRRVSLEVLIDDKDPSRCGADCRYLGWSVARPDGGGLRYSCDLFPQASVEPTRHPECIEATALAAADDAVLEAADRWDVGDGKAADLSEALERALRTRRKLRATSAKDKP